MASSELPADFQELEGNLIGLYDLVRDVTFIGEVSPRMRCTQCQDLMLRVYQGTCGHHFCGPCVQNALVLRQRCRMCHDLWNLKQVHRGEAQLQIEREVASLSVYCPFGCGNPCLMKEILVHKSTCPASASWQASHPTVSFQNGAKGAFFLRSPDPSVPVATFLRPCRQVSDDERRWPNEDRRRVEARSATPEEWTLLKEEFVSKFRRLTEEVNRLRVQNHRFERQMALLKKEVRDLADSATRSVPLPRDATVVDGPRTAAPSYDVCGRVSWKIQVSYENWEGILRSPEIGASVPGYRFRVEAYATTIGNARFLGLDLVSLKGPRDDRLGWPFAGDVEVTLADKYKDPFRGSSRVLLERAGAGCDVCRLRNVRLSFDAIETTETYLLDHCICLVIVVRGGPSRL